MATATDLFECLRQKAGFEVVSHTEATNQLRCLGRLLDDHSGTNTANWRVVIFRLLTASKKKRPWTIDISKSYFIREETGKLVFAWRVILQGDHISNHYTDLVNLVRTSPAARSDISEISIPLSGGSNNTAGGRRGAGPMGTVAVGQAAVFNKMRGS